jgi:hypothetical protein
VEDGDDNAIYAMAFTHAEIIFFLLKTSKCSTGKPSLPARGVFVLHHGRFGVELCVGGAPGESIS